MDPTENFTLRLGLVVLRSAEVGEVNKDERLDVSHPVELKLPLLKFHPCMESPSDSPEEAGELNDVFCAVLLPRYPVVVRPG
jgi:hypothetical protein